MNKNKIIEYLTGSNNVKAIDNEAVELMNAIERTKIEIQSAQCAFDNVDDPKLIEVAIYSEEVAKRRYEYLIGLARKMGLKVSNEYVLEQCSRLAE